MGGKRPDQYRIDPDEAGATDYKRYPDQPNETEKDKQLYGRVMKGDARRQQPVRPKAPSPEADEDRGAEDRTDEISE